MFPNFIHPCFFWSCYRTIVAAVIVKFSDFRNGKLFGEIFKEKVAFENSKIVGWQRANFKLLYRVEQKVFITLLHRVQIDWDSYQV